MENRTRTNNGDSFLPEIRRKVDLGDLKLWEPLVTEKNDTIHGSSPRSPFSKSKCRACSCHACECGPNSAGVESFIPQPARRRSFNGYDRPKLVSVDDFRSSLVSMAQGIVTQQRSLHQQADQKHQFVMFRGYQNTRDVSKERLDTSPLIEAVRKSSSTNNTHAITPPVPFLRADCAVQTGESSRKRSIPVDGTISLSPKLVLKLVRIRERIAARVILKNYRKYLRRVRLRQNSINESDKKLKTMMKEVVMSALSNSRLIRDELTGIRNELSKTPKPATVLPPAPQTPNPVTSGTEVPVFKSVRVLLGPGVTSPIAMDRFIDDLTAGKGRNAIRLCVAQQTLHPKAFVIVAAVDNLSIEEWQSRIVNSFYVYAWDRAFPLYQSTMPGLPWEIRVKNGMSSIIPQWIYVGPHAAYNSSLG